MIVYILLFAILCLIGVKISHKEPNGYFSDYMSVNKTMSIKGIFIIIVFFAHFNSYVEYTLPIDVKYYELFSLIGQRMVTLFLFYSGYGVMESIKKKKMNYVKRIPIQRFLGTLFRFDIAILLFLILKIALKMEFTVPQLLLSFVAWDSLGNSNWYIFAVLAAYLITYIAFMICRDKGKFYPAAFLVTVGAAVYVFILAHFELKQGYWYNTMILYPCGIWYSLFRDKIERIVNKNTVIWLLCFSVSAVGECLTVKYANSSFAIYTVSMLLFATVVVLFTMRVSLDNKILRWCGKYLFGLYILQRIPMILFKSLGLASYNIYLYFALCLVVSVVLAWLFEKYTGKLWSLISTPKTKIKSENG